MGNWLDLTSFIGGSLLTISLIALGIFAMRHGQKQKGLLLLLAGLCAAILIVYTVSTPQSL